MPSNELLIKAWGRISQLEERQKDLEKSNEETQSLRKEDQARIIKLIELWESSDSELR